MSADYAFQAATYRQLTTKASGLVRLDTLVANKDPEIVTQAYEVSPLDLTYTQCSYPLVQQAMRDGLYLPNRGSNLCSRKHCNFAEACAEFGACVRGKVEE